MRFAGIFILIFFSHSISAQNDLDAIRYSRLSQSNGSSRYTAMGGAFGALGADLGCATTNPAGLGIYRKGDVNFSAGLRFTHNTGTAYGKTVRYDDANFVYNNFGVAMAWNAENDKESRHVLAFTSTQLQNFYNATRISGYTNSNSIALDMLNKAQAVNNRYLLDYTYEGLGYNTYLLDSMSGKFYSFVDTKRSLLQTRDIKTGGRINELNFSYAYSLKDKFYFGVSIGIPRTTYTSTTTHYETDDKDSMKIYKVAPGTYSSTYMSDLLGVDTTKLGFNSLKYTEYFATSGSGLNAKLGMVARVNSWFRAGVYVHTPTIYNNRDYYYYDLESTFDLSPKSPVTAGFPDEGTAYFDYKIITPARFGIAAGFIIKKLGAFNIDYELVDYRKAKLGSDDPSDFAGVNAVIDQKYSIASNIRAGAEFNIKPVMLRAGYVMQGSPFGELFSGDFVRHTISLGFGFRTKSNFYYDFAWVKNISSEKYYMFQTLSTSAAIRYNNSMLAATIGLKF